MEHKYKVGDKVRLVTNGGFHRACHAGMIGEIVSVSGDHGCGVVCEWDNKGDCESLYFLMEEIEPYIEPTPKPAAADAFRMIHEALYAGVDAMLDDCDYETALKYAAMMHAIEQFTPKPTT